MEDLMKSFEQLNIAGEKLKFFEDGLEEWKNSKSKIETALKKHLHESVGEDKWIYFDGKLYGLSCDNWGGHSSSLMVMNADIKKLSNGDLIDDWTGKLGYKQKHFD